MTEKVTAVSIIKNCVDKIKFQQEVNFFAGTTASVVNYIEKLKKHKDVFPAVVVFREGLFEEKTPYGFIATYPKIAIVAFTDIEMTDNERFVSRYNGIIYPIYEQLTKEILKIDVKAKISRTDIPYVVDNERLTFFDLVDGCVIKNLKISYENVKKCEDMAKKTIEIKKEKNVKIRYLQGSVLAGKVREVNEVLADKLVNNRKAEYYYE